jgi:DNA-directed RNA polymerase specialized sigma24 family protein
MAANTIPDAARRPTLTVVANQPAPAAPASPDYARLLAAVAAGDTRAEAELLTALSPPLEVVLRNRARGCEGVDDLRQEALLVILTAARAGRIHEPLALVEFALETARRLAMNAERKHARHRTGNDEAALEAATDGHSGGSDWLAGEQLRHCVHNVLGSLGSERDRQILYGYYLDEQPSARLQAHFALDSAQLARVLHRARQRFGELWRRRRIEVPEF